MMESHMNNGMCRCCSSEGTFKDVKSKYHWMGEEEVYSEMLRECFDIALSSNEGDDGGICEVCITQLRNAANFKKQVLYTEEQFKKRLHDKVLKNDIKIEFGKFDSDNESDNDNDNNMSEDFSAPEFEVPIKKEEDEPKPRKRAAAKATTSKAKKAKTDDGETSTKQSQKCRICDKQFTSTFNLKRHIQTKHELDTIITGKKLCEGCGRVFFNEDWLAKHLAVGCPNSAIRICVKCNIKFERKSDMYKHMRRSHWTEYKLLKLNCPLCDGVFKSHEEHDGHLMSEHHIQLDYQELTFENEEDLNEWKQDIEAKQNVCFLKRISSPGTYYHCYPVKYLGASRILGRVKVCPARIELTETAGLVLVSYQSTHVCDKGDVEKSKSFCQLCDGDVEEDLSEHWKVIHDFDENIERLSFKGFDDFLTWKSKIEKESVQFYKRSSTVNIKSGSKIQKTYFYCKQSCKTKSLTKTCPAYITLTWDERFGTDGVAPKRRKKKKADESATPERVEHRVNLTSILQYSNASPFRDKTMRGFSCLYCAKYFQDIDDLREHTAQQSEKDKINSMIDYKLSYNPIKVDITDLCCTVCDTEMRDLNDLKDHLVTTHNKTIHKNIKDIILPFRLENGHNFTCVICSVVHISFKNLYHHMSSHYRNYCCKKCGAGYITIAALRKHGKTHYQGDFPCDYCEKSYTSLTKKRNHEKGVHTGGWLRNKCPHCTEIFVSYYDRSEHLVKVHNEAPVVYPCNACNKTYKKKFELNRHIKHHHLQQRSFLCDKCNAKFFSKRGLADHLSRHTGGEVCSCEICGKKFSRLRTLKDHLKIHEDDKRFQCEICKKTFMQKCSLKSHVRLHQDDLDIFKEFEDVKHLIDNRDLTLKQIAAENKKKEQAEKMQRQLT